MSGQERTAYFAEALNGRRTLPDALGAALAQTCVLPWPPSVNQLARVDRRGRAAYRDEAIIALRAQRIRAYGRDERVAVRIWCYPPDQRARDIDNLAKAPLDALERGGILVNDSQIDDLRIVRRTPDPAMPRIEIGLALLVGKDEAIALVDALELAALERPAAFSAEQVDAIRHSATLLRTKLGGAP